MHFFVLVDNLKEELTYLSVPDPMELGYYYVPPIPQPPPVAPNRNPLVDKLLESLISSVKFFASAENFTAASTELMAKVNGVFELARLMKLTRMKESEHEHVWIQVRPPPLSSFLSSFLLFPFSFFSVLDVCGISC